MAAVSKTPGHLINPLFDPADSVRVHRIIDKGNFHRAPLGMVPVIKEHHTDEYGTGYHLYPDNYQ